MAFQGDSIFWVEVEKIVPNPFQPRREFDEDKLKELSESIRMYGVLQPLTVTRKEVYHDDGSFRTEYELIAGERRLRASRLAGLEQVPVLIRSGEQTEQEKLELAIIENLQREDLNAVDRALAFKQLADMFNLSHVDVAKKVGRSREYVSNSIRLLSLPDKILESLKRNEISEGHARTLLMLKDRPEEQDVVYREILLKKLSVREVERISRKIASDKVRKREWQDTDAHLIEMERAFTDTLGTRVQISKTEFGGKLTIDYFSETDLEKLLAAVREKENLFAVAASAAVVAESGETVIRAMDEIVAPLADIVDATPLEVVTSDVAVSDSVAQELPQSFASSVAPEPPAVPEPTPFIPPVSPQGRAEVLVAPSVPTAFTTPDVAVPVPPSTVSMPYAVTVPPALAATAPEVSTSEVSMSPAPEETVPATDIPTVRREEARVIPQYVPIPPPPPIAPNHTEPNEDDLYSMRNFSL